jgi:hypothetical protein
VTVENLDWLERARRVEAVRVDVGFVIHPSVYYGPFPCGREQWLTLRQPLRPPHGERQGRLLLSRSLNADALADLVRYYRDVLGCYAAHGVELVPERRGYFDVTLVVFSPEDCTISFGCCCTTWRHVDRTFAALTGEGDGELFYDLDEGYEYEVQAVGPRLFLRAGDGGAVPGLVCVVCDRLQFAQQAREAWQRGRQTVRRLRRLLGRDLWHSR